MNKRLRFRPRLSHAGTQTYASFGDIVVVMHDVPGQPEVTDLHYLALREEDVPGSQVAVNTLQNKQKELR